MMKNLFLNDLVFLLTNRFRLKKSLTEFSPDLFGTLNGNCFIANAILLKKRQWFDYKETDKTETYTINL